MLRWEDVDHVALDPEHAALEFQFIAGVLHLREAAQDGALFQALALAKMQDHAVVIHRVANAVDGGHGGDDHAVFPFQQCLGGGQAHLFDVLVDAGVFLDEQVARGHVGLGLVVVVVGDEVFHGIVREKFAELGIQLRGQGLVRRHHEGRPAQSGDDVGHGVGLARAGHAQQGLETHAGFDAIHQPFDGGRLVAGREEGLMQCKRAIGISDSQVKIRALVEPAIVASQRGHVAIS